MKWTVVLALGFAVGWIAHPSKDDIVEKPPEKVVEVLSCPKVAEPVCTTDASVASAEAVVDIGVQKSEKSGGESARSSAQSVELKAKTVVKKMANATRFDQDFQRVKADFEQTNANLWSYKSPQGQVVQQTVEPGQKFKSVEENYLGEKVTRVNEASGKPVFLETVKKSGEKIIQTFYANGSQHGLTYIDAQGKQVDVVKYMNGATKSEMFSTGNGKMMVEYNEYGHLEKRWFLSADGQKIRVK